MDRLKLIEVIAAAIRDEIEIEDDYLRSVESVEQERAEKVAEISGKVADALIASGSLRSLAGSRDDPEGGTMPGGPWSGRP